MKEMKHTQEEEEDLSDLEVDLQNENSVPTVNDKEQLDSACNRIKQEFNKLLKVKNNEHINWIETMDVTANDRIDEDLNVDDDIKRELIFYNLTVVNAATGISKLKECGEKLNRPGDFFAEMIKSDNQMEKVRKQIVNERQHIKKLEEKKNKMQNIKFAKAVREIFL